MTFNLKYIKWRNKKLSSEEVVKLELEKNGWKVKKNYSQILTNFRINKNIFLDEVGRPDYMAEKDKPRKFVEVKIPGTGLSLSQILWIRVALKNNLNVELWYVLKKYSLDLEYDKKYRKSDEGVNFIDTPKGWLYIIEGEREL